MTIIKTGENDKITLTVEGKLNTGASQQFQEAVMAALEEANELILDFTQLVYLASSGIRVLVLGAQTAEVSGKTLVLTNVNDDVMEVFEITGLTDALTIL
ncbi:MAG: STAS domain-containing protein [Oscillospiraceae bacterium]|nr:STAS domain-containing protein [Oscillospiraceae bacterium]